MAKTDFDNCVSSLDSKITVNKTKTESIKMSLKSNKHLIKVVLLAEDTLKEMERKII